MSMTPFWVRGGRRSIVEHPDDIKEIMNYLRTYGDLRVNAKKVEILYTHFSKSRGTDWLVLTAIALENFATWLESEIDENTYYTVLMEYDAWISTFRLSE